MRLEAAATEAAAWRSAAQSVAAAAQQAREELQERAADMDGTSIKARQLADALAAAATAVTGASAGLGMPGSPGASGAGHPLPPRQAMGLQFQRTSPGSGGSGSGRGRAGGLPRLKTRAVYGASLRQPGDSPGGIPAHLPALRGSPPSPHSFQRERGNGNGGVAWSASGSADRQSESKRDAARFAHMAARWNQS